MKKPQMQITHRDAGFGAFCNGCQPKRNNFRRLLFTLPCKVVEVTNDVRTHKIFLCERCIESYRTEAKQTGAFHVIDHARV